MKKHRSLYSLLFFSIFLFVAIVAIAVTLVVSYLSYAALDDASTLPYFLLASSTQLASFAFVLLLVTLVVSRVLTEIITKPLRDINLNHPLNNDTYEEIQPLLKRVNDQRKMLEEQNKLLEDTNKMRRDFTGNVSHEMKTPLQVIGGYAELMENNMVPPEDIKKTATLIRKEAETMRDLIDDVLTLSKLDENAEDTNSIVDLSQVTKCVAIRLAHKAEKREQEIILNVEDDVKINGGTSLTEQMVYNLVDNAIKYNKQGGIVTIELIKRASVVKLSVSDEGPGIPISQRDRVFERFYRVDESRSRETGGTGLGLAIVKHSVENISGRIEIKDNPDTPTGAKFVVKIPALD